MNDKQMANTRLGPGPDSENKSIRNSYLPSVDKSKRAQERMDATKKRVAASKRLKSKRITDMPDGLAKQIAMLK